VVMDQARKLLDSLMGTRRNAPIRDAQKTRGENFKEDNVCKFYLLGFCPQHEQLFISTKRDLGDCNKVHSDAMRKEFQDHSDHERYRRKYEREFRDYLECCIRDADAWVAREKKHVQREFAESQEKGGSKALEEVERLNKESAALLAEAETLAEAGDFGLSQQKVQLSEQAKKQANDVQARGRSPPKMDEVCDICGVRTEAGDGARMQAHLAGKKHLGYLRIREALSELREKMRQDERQASRSQERVRPGDADPKARGLEREPERERGRDRDMDRDRDRNGERERDREWRREREPEARGDRERRRSRSRSRHRRRLERQPVK